MIGFELGWNNGSFKYDDLTHQSMREEMEFERERIMQKAMTTGSGLVTDQATGGQALREQYLFNELEVYGPEQVDAGLVREMPMKEAESTLLEWSLRGGPTRGDGAVAENGSDSLFGVDFMDDPLVRMNETVAFLAEGRQIGRVTTRVKNIVDPEEVAKDGAMTSLFQKANLMGYFGDRTLAQNHFNGLFAQIMNWADQHVDHYGCMFDCQGKPLGKELMLQACTENANRFGEIDLIMQSMIGKSDTTALIWPESRREEGRGGQMGGMYNKFMGPAGEVRLAGDKMLRANQPLITSGTGADGLPRTTATLDAGSVAWAGSTPFSVNSAGAAGAGNWWNNFTKNTATAALATVPAVPSGYLAGDGGNNFNNLKAGSYYYAVSIVYKGLESPAYILGAGTQAANVISGAPTAVAVTAGQVVTLTFDTTQITGLGSTVARANIKLRVYRCGGPNAVAPTMLNQFSFLQECGIPSATSTTTLYDNGMNIPGCDNALGVTTKKGRHLQWGWMNLMPLMKLPLPRVAMAEQAAYLWFTVPLFRVRPFHIHFRNIGRA